MLINRLRDLMQRRFIRDTAILQSGQLILIAIQALTNFVLIRQLGSSLLGIYVLITTLASLAGLLDLTGSTRVTSTRLAKAIAQGDPDEIRDILAFFLRINIQFNVPLVVLFFALAPEISRRLYQNPTLGVWAGLLAFTELTDIPTQMVGIVYQCQGRMSALVRYETTKLLLTSAMTVTVLLLGWGIPGLVIGSLWINFSFSVLSVRRYARVTRTDPLIPRWNILFQRATSVPIGSRLRLGFSMAVDKNLDSLLDKLIVLFIGTLGTVFVGNYSLALKIVTLPQPLLSGLARNLDVFMPKQAARSVQSLRETFIQTTVLSGAIWALVTVAIGIGAPFVIWIAFPDYMSALPLVYPLLLQSLALGFGIGLGSVIRTLGHMEYSIGIHIVFLVLLIPAGMLLVHRFGSYGGALLPGLVEIALVALVTGVVLIQLRTPQVVNVV